MPQIKWRCHRNTVRRQLSVVDSRGESGVRSQLDIIPVISLKGCGTSCYSSGALMLCQSYTSDASSALGVAVRSTKSLVDAMSLVGEPVRRGGGHGP